MNRKHLLLFFVIISGQVTAQSLAEKGFARYTTGEGLSDNTVTGIAQDATGYMWISTASGLNRFNGSRFVQYHSSSDSLSLAAEDILELSWLDGHNLAVSTAGLHIVDTKTGAEQNIFIPYHRRLYQYKFNMLIRAKGDAQGNVYLLSRSGFYQFDKTHKLVFRFDYYSEEAVLTHHFVFGEQLLELDSLRLLIVSRDALYVYHKKKRLFKKMEAADCPVMAEVLNRPAYAFSFLQQKAGHLLVLKYGTDSLIYIDAIRNKKTTSRLPAQVMPTEFGWRTRLIPVSDTVFYLTGHFSGFFKLRFYPESGGVKFDPQKYFAAFLCTSILKDKDGYLWVGTDKGLFRQDPGRLQVEVTQIPSDLDRLFPNLMLSEVFTTAKNVYIGTRNFGNLLLYDKSKLQFIRALSLEQYRKSTGQSLTVFAITEADSGTLLLATGGPLLLVNKACTKSWQIRPAEWEQDDWSADLYKDSKGTIWISSYRVYQYVHNRHTFSAIPDAIQLSSQIIQPEAIREDGTGNMWLAGHGLGRYNTTLQRFDLRLDSFPYINMPDRQVTAMVIDKKQNTIWFNSTNNGLVSYNIGNGTFRHFTTSDGLPDNNIAALVIVNNKLWIVGATSGIACLDLYSLQITGFGKEDGFPDMPVFNRANAFYDSASRQLYIAFSKAITCFYPDQLLHRKIPPCVFIEDVAINNEWLYLPPERITTSWKNNEVKVAIGTINFLDAGTQRFAYRIVKDATTPWIEMGNQPSFSISSLSPGTYRVQVKVYSFTNRWPEQVKELSIVVTPPLWLKHWFLGLAIAIALVSLYLFIKWRIRLARRKEMEKTHIEKLKADHYKSQFELEQITNYFSSSLAGKKTEQDVLWDVAANLIGRMNYEECIIYGWNENKTKMVQKAAYGPKGTPETIYTNVFEVTPGQGIVGHVIETKQPLLVNDTRKDSRYRVDDEFRLSELAVPIIHNDELLGVLDSENSASNYFSERDVKILTTIATLLGNKLKQLESEQSLEAKQLELASINEQLAEARLSALQAQMNPHFVFNALNSIKRMILDGDDDMASRYLSKFALMIRMTLEHSKEIFVTLDENIEYLKAYLDMEQLRFGDSFSYNIHTDESIDVEEILIPSLMIQPLVENAIWHGLMQAEKDKKIQVTFSQAQGKIVCTVEDNGIGIRRSEKLREKQRPLHRSVGLQNLQKRIGIINEKYNTACSLQIEDLADAGTTGTRVVLQLNLLTTYQKS